ncbi:MAG: hypothetical protein HKP58_03475 [Desulfatitalea sp.]|nr:hypothetical protein [Desulfatitalea sp.]NNJ99452.1 hypothetical protein [Desulfatitalea sp.]
MFAISWGGACAAETYRFDLRAGSSSIAAGLHHKTYLDTGYLRVGGSGVYADDDRIQYQWASLDLTVGSDTLRPGFNCDVGLRGLLGSAEDTGRKGDIGSFGFTIFAGYLFPPEVTGIPLELFGGLTLSPEIMSFWDSENYREIKLGFGFRIIKNASLQLAYTNYRVDMKNTPDKWALNEDAYQFGLVMRF